MFDEGKKKKNYSKGTGKKGLIFEDLKLTDILSE